VGRRKKEENSAKYVGGRVDVVMYIVTCTLVYDRC
jgi:hypothetical protein